MRSLVAVPLLILATVAAAEERPLYSAQDSLRRAQVGTFSPRLAPPVRVQKTPRGGARQFERMECRPDPSRPLERAIICTPAETEKVKYAIDLQDKFLAAGWIGALSLLKVWAFRARALIVG